MASRIEWTSETVMSRVTIADDGCWLWTRPVMRDGYARLGHIGKHFLAHRFVYELLVGPISDGYTLDHVCHNGDSECPGGIRCLHRRCVNPLHLEPVVQGENNRRRTSRTDTCPNGHPRTPENILQTRKRGRACRVCRRESEARFRERRRSAS